MRLVEDEGVVAQQVAVALDLGEQDPVGHQLDQRAVADLVGEPDGVADGVAQWGTHFVGDALRDGAGGQAPGLGVADRAADAAAQVQADLGQLRRLARSGLAGDDDDLVRPYRLGDLLPPLADRQVRIGDRRDRGLPGRYECFGGGDLFGELLQLLGLRLSEMFQVPAEPGCVARRQSVESAAQFRDGWFGHSGQDRRSKLLSLAGRCSDCSVA